MGVVRRVAPDVAPDDAVLREAIEVEMNHGGLRLAPENQDGGLDPPTPFRGLWSGERDTDCLVLDFQQDEKA
jgi:hypothetical protein